MKYVALVLATPASLTGTAHIADTQEEAIKHALAHRSSLAGKNSVSAANTYVVVAGVLTDRVEQPVKYELVSL